MPRGRKKCHQLIGIGAASARYPSSTSPTRPPRLVRSVSETSSLGAEEPKIKDCRLDSRCASPCSGCSSSIGGFMDDQPPKLVTMASVSPTTRRQSPSKMKITDYFPPSSPPVLLPQVPASSSMSNSSVPADQASDRSEGDSGKENEEEPGCELGARSKGESAKGKSGAGVMTRSRAAANKKPPLSLSTARLADSSNTTAATRSGNRNSGGQFQTPPPSPTKSPQPPKSPPTPHKIQLPLGRSSDESTALQKLKSIAFSPKKKAPVVTAAATAASSAMVSEAVADRRELSTRKAVSPDRAAAVAKNLRQDTGPKKKSVETTPSKATRSKLSAAKAAAAAAASSHKVTEYFPIRRSGRKPKKALEKEQLEDVESHLLADCDDELDLTVVHLADKGRGVVATRTFEKGEFVVEYSGDLIDVGIAKERESQYSLDLSTGCYMYYFKHKGKQYCIDATKETGRLGRLVNHSRQNPNLQTKVIMIADTPRLILVAKKTVEKGEELLYDYGDRSKESLKAHPWLAL